MKKVICVALAAALAMFDPDAGAAGLIPADLDARPASESEALGADALVGAGLSPAEARSRVQSLDAAELAQLQRTDLSQQGGEAWVIVLAVIGAIALLSFLLNAGDDDDDDDDDDGGDVDVDVDD